MRYDAKFVRALERRYANKFIHTSGGRKHKQLQVCFWFTHLGQEQMFKYEYTSVIQPNLSMNVTGGLLMYYSNKQFQTPWSSVNQELFTKKYDFDWNHPKLSIAKECMFKDVRQTKEEIAEYEKQVRQFNKRNNISV